MIQIVKDKLLPASISIPKFIIRAAQLLQFISPRLATNFAAFLFSKPVKFPRPEREKMMWESAQKTKIHISTIDKDIEVLTYGFSNKKVLLVHGWSGRSTQFFMLADKLLENGYMVISFDAPAHGNSEGKNTLMPDFIECIHELNTQFGPFEAAVGHSLGGMSLYNAIADGFEVKTLVSIGSGNKISDIIANFVQNLKLKPKVAVQLKRFYDKKFNADIDSFASSEKAKHISTPTLIIHDSLDGDVSVSCAYQIRQNLQNGFIVTTNGLGHTKILRDKHVNQRIVSFIKQYS